MHTMQFFVNEQGCEARKLLVLPFSTKHFSKTLYRESACTLNPSSGQSNPMEQTMHALHCKEFRSALSIYHYMEISSHEWGLKQTGSHSGIWRYICQCPVLDRWGQYLDISERAEIQAGQHMHSGTLDITHNNVNEMTTPTMMMNKKKCERVTIPPKTWKARILDWICGRQAIKACHWCNLQYAGKFCALHILSCGNTSCYPQMNKFMNTVDMLYMPLVPMLIELNVYTSVCIAKVYDALQSKSRKGSCEICTREIPGSEMSNGHCRASTQRGLFGCCKPCPIQGPWLANNTQSTVR